MMQHAETTAPEFLVRRGNDVQHWVVAHPDPEIGIVLVRLRSKRSAEAARARLAEMSIDWAVETTESGMRRLRDTRSRLAILDLRAEVAGT